MNTRLYRATAAVALLIAMKIGWDLVFSPMNAIRSDLARELERVPARAPATIRGDLDYAAVLNPILDKPQLWGPLIPDAPAAPAPPPNAPDLRKMLEGLSMRPGQIGSDKMRVGLKDGPEDAWMAIGEAYNGCELVSFTREEAVFRYRWREQNRDLTIRLPRPLR